MNNELYDANASPSSSSVEQSSVVQSLEFGTNATLAEQVSMFLSSDNLSTNVGGSFFPQIAASGSNLYVVWYDTTGNNDIFFKSSIYNGVTFDPTINLSNNAGDSSFPEITVSGSNVYVVWQDATPGNQDIFFRRSTNSGFSFDPTINLSANAGFSSLPQIAVSGSNVYVVWYDSTPGNNDIFFKRSIDNGVTFDPFINLSANARDSTLPQLAISGSNVYVVWQDGTVTTDIFFRRSIDSGVSFDPIINLSANAGLSSSAQIAASGSNVYVVWQEGAVGNSDILSARSTNSGAKFGCANNLSNNAGESSFPQVVVSGSNVHVVWNDATPGNYDIFFTRNIDSLPSCTVNNLSNNPGNSFSAQIAVSGSNVHVVWEDSTPVYSDIFFRRSTDSGVTFDPIINLSNNAGFSSFPHLAVSGPNVYVVWNDNTPGNYDIFFRRSIDNGANFDPIINLSTNVGGSSLPQIAVAGSNVYVVWYDSTPGNQDIFFRRSIDNGATFSPFINLSADARDSSFPQLAVFGSNVYVVWQDATPINKDIFFRRSIDNGATFSPFINLSTSAGFSSLPQIVVSGSNVYVVWQDATPGNNDIFFRRSFNSGANFDPATINLSTNAGESSSPQISVSSPNVYVVWSDTTPGNQEIFFRPSW